MKGGFVKNLTFAAMVIAVAGAAFWDPVTTAQSRKSVWDGVYAPEQATRGKATFETTCAGCHGADLSGQSGPALAGERFKTKWDFQAVNQLFTEIRTRMPRNNPSTLSDETYLDLVTYILQANAFPSGTEPLLLDATTLGGIMIQKEKGAQPAEVATGTLVQVVGCLSQDGDNWMLSPAGAPVRTDTPDASKGDQRAALERAPLGSYRIQLLGVYGSVETHKGHRMEAKGFIVRDPGGDRITVASFEMVGPSCAP